MKGKFYLFSKGSTTLNYIEDIIYACCSSKGNVYLIKCTVQQLQVSLNSRIICRTVFVRLVELVPQMI